MLRKHFPENVYFVAHSPPGGGVLFGIKQALFSGAYLVLSPQNCYCHGSEYSNLVLGVKRKNFSFNVPMAVLKNHVD